MTTCIPSYQHDSIISMHQSARKQNNPVPRITQLRLKSCDLFSMPKSGCLFFSEFGCGRKKKIRFLDCLKVIWLTVPFWLHLELYIDFLWNPTESHTTTERCPLLCWDHSSAVWLSQRDIFLQNSRSSYYLWPSHKL